MSSRYREISNLQYCDILYEEFVIERCRTIITRWRLSCHKLRIEIGRYTRPKTPRHERKCKICNIVEDEQHALFYCSVHVFIRQHYIEIQSQYTTVQTILHPKTATDANTIGKYLIDIEDNMNPWKMVGNYWEMGSDQLVSPYIHFNSIPRHTSFYFQHNLVAISGYHNEYAWFIWSFLRSFCNI